MGRLVGERIERAARQIRSRPARGHGPDPATSGSSARVRSGTSADAPAGRYRQPRSNSSHAIIVCLTPDAGSNQRQHRRGVRIAGMPGPAANATVPDLDASGQAPDRGDRIGLPSKWRHRRPAHRPCGRVPSRRAASSPRTGLPSRITRTRPLSAAWISSRPSDRKAAPSRPPACRQSLGQHGGVRREGMAGQHTSPAARRRPPARSGAGGPRRDQARPA